MVDIFLIHVPNSCDSVQICIRKDGVRMATEKRNNLKLFLNGTINLIRFMMNKRTMALGTVNTVHADWDTNVNPTQTAC